MRNIIKAKGTNQVIGYAVRNINTGLWDAEINGQRKALGYMNAGAVTMWVRRNADKATVSPWEAAREAARVEGAKMGLTAEQMERFIARMS
ncbi:hypothetical protein RKD49_005416 [Streptomyces glaucescens]